MKTIVYREQYDNLEHHPILIPKWDAEGEPVWKTPPDAEGKGGVSDTVVADTYLLIRYILKALAGTRLIYRADDPQRTAGIYIALDAADEDKTTGGPGDVKLGDKSYAWFKLMLSRQLPLNEEGKAAEMTPETFAHVLWQNDCALIQNMLLDPTEQENLADEV